MGKNAICVSGNGARLVIIGKMVLFFPKPWRKDILEGLLGVKYSRSPTVKIGHS